MKAAFFLSFYLLVSISLPAHAAPKENCGSTVQTFWELNKKTRRLSLKQFARHEDKICDREKLTNTNATVHLLDRKKKLVRKLPAFIPLENYFDDDSGPQLQGGVEAPDVVVFQLKFADSGDFAKVRYLKVKFTKGGSYGPAKF
jgi:hypothetical protein